MKVGRIVDDVGGTLISVAFRWQVWTLLHHNIVKLVFPTRTNKCNGKPHNGFYSFLSFIRACIALVSVKS